MSEQSIYNNFIEGKLINLINLTEDIVNNSNWYKWFNDEETTLHLQKHYFPNSKEDQINFFNSHLKDNKTTLQLGILDKKKSILFGVISLNNINYFNRNADWSVVIGEKKYRQLIYVNEAIDLLLRHAFFTLNLKKINGGYIETLNDLGKFYQKRFNFKIEGKQRAQVYKSGKYLDITLIGLLKEEFMQITQSTKE